MKQIIQGTVRAAGTALVVALGAAGAAQLPAAPLPLVASEGVAGRIINPTTAEVSLPGGMTLTVDFYGDNIVRLFCDPKGGIVRNPEAQPPADILVPDARRALTGAIKLTREGGKVIVSSPGASVAIAADGMVSITDKEGNTVMEQTEPLAFGDESVTLGLRERDGEWYYG
ncbi:MAG: hypothetical protein K2L63_00430, partial [Paramuribaculum sp.]|nr:hypothetical protein [Paramuribaculum sp.]